MELIILILLLMIARFVDINYVAKIQICSIICSVKNNISIQATVDGKRATIYRVDYYM